MKSIDPRVSAFIEDVEKSESAEVAAQFRQEVEAHPNSSEANLNVLLLEAIKKVPGALERRKFNEKLMIDSALRQIGISYTD